MPASLIATYVCLQRDVLSEFYARTIFASQLVEKPTNSECAKLSSRTALNLDLHRENALLATPTTFIYLFTTQRNHSSPAIHQPTVHVGSVKLGSRMDLIIIFMTANPSSLVAQRWDGRTVYVLQIDHLFGVRETRADRTLLISKTIRTMNSMKTGSQLDRKW